MYRDYLYSIDLLGRIVNTRRRRRALSSDLRRADGTSKPAQTRPGALNPHRGKTMLYKNDGAKTYETKWRGEKSNEKRGGSILFENWDFNPIYRVQKNVKDRVKKAVIIDRLTTSRSRSICLYLQDHHRDYRGNSPLHQFASTQLRRISTDASVIYRRCGKTRKMRNSL